MNAVFSRLYIDGLVQERLVSIANALELHLPRTNSPVNSKISCTGNSHYHNGLMIDFGISSALAMLTPVLH